MGDFCLLFHLCKFFCGMKCASASWSTRREISLLFLNCTKPQHAFRSLNRHLEHIYWEKYYWFNFVEQPLLIISLLGLYTWDWEKESKCFDEKNIRYILSFRFLFFFPIWKNFIVWMLLTPPPSFSFSVFLFLFEKTLLYGWF